MNNIPQHIAIIMDGNRRWAKSQGKPVSYGHKVGADALDKIVRYTNKIGIKHLTVYAFSTENWKRATEEVGTIMLLLEQYINYFLGIADTENIQLNLLGDIAALTPKLQQGIQKSIERTKTNTGMIFNIAINYGGRSEILRATKLIAENVKLNKLNIEEITEETISNNLYTAGQPDPDIVVRTSGEMRLSNYLLWQVAYSELIFMDKYWPEFTSNDIDEVIKIYNGRNRKFGAG